MEVSTVDVIATAVAPIVMVSATGLLFIGVQTNNIHLADRARDLITEHRKAIRCKDRGRREAVTAQLKQRGLVPQQNVQYGFHIKDPDGVVVQIV